jgi:hypothetical protein
MEGGRVCRYAGMHGTWDMGCRYAGMHGRGRVCRN